MAKAYFEGREDEWVEIKEALPSIALDDLLRVGMVAANIGEKVEFVRGWIVSALSAWHMLDGSTGKALDGIPTAALLGRLDQARMKFVITNLQRAVLELPLDSVSPSPSASTPEKVAPPG